MKTISTAVAALALSAMMMTGSTTEAKADGGVIVIGVGAYLLTDAIVGRRCDRDEWPFNIVRKIADELHGRPGCHRREFREDHPRRHDRKYR